MDSVHQYWRFNLSPYIFEVKNIPFGWLETWWGALLTLVVFIGGGILVKTKLLPPKFNEALKNILFYAMFILAALFGLQKYGIAWGLRWYSTMYIIGFLTIYFGFLYWSHKKVLMLTEPMIVSFITYTIIGMLLGARLTYVFVYNWSEYKNNLLSIFATWEGGLSFHGGIIGVIIAVFLFAKIHNVPFYHITDKAVRLVPVGIAFGRVGNFMNGELWGRPITEHVPWAIIFPTGGNVPRHPSQIYQSLGEGVLLFVTLYLLSFKKRTQGQMSAFFLIFYCIYRFFVEYFRAADEQLNYFFTNHFSWAPLGVYTDSSWWAVLTMGQILCLIFACAGVVMYWSNKKSIIEGSPEWVARNNGFFKNVERENS